MNYNPYKENEGSFKLPSFNIPESTPLSLKTGALIFTGVAVVGIGIGAAIGTQIFFGTVALAGLVAIAETNKYVKWCIVHGNKYIDMAIFAGSIYAMFALGVTVAGGLIFTGLGYTIVYAPYVRQQHQLKSIKYN